MQCTQQPPEVLWPDLLFWNLCYCLLEGYRSNANEQVVILTALPMSRWSLMCVIAWRRTSLKAASAFWQCHMTCTTQQHDVSRWPKETAMRSMRHLVSASCGCVSCHCNTAASSYAVFYTGGHDAITAGHECCANVPVVQNDVAILSHLQILDIFPSTRPVW